jgi:hypothetical protein
MRFFLLNTLAAGILIGIRVFGPLWICRRTTPKKMKKLFTVFALLLAIVSCTKSKDDNPAPQPPAKVNVRFYSTNAVTSTKPITAQVNGTNYGTIKYSASQPDCSAAGFGMVQLKPGVYAVDYLDPANPMANKQVSITVPQGATTCVFFDLK